MHPFHTHYHPHDLLGHLVAHLGHFLSWLV